MGKKNWWTGEGIIWSNEGDKAQTQTVTDPLKTAVSTPLSEFLKSKIGTGLPNYSQSTGKPLYEPLDPKAYNTYQNFLGINPGEWYDKAVVKPTMEDIGPQMDLLSEGWAGSLRGSGRYRDLEDFTQDTATELGKGRYQAELQIPQAQFGMAQGYSDMKTKQYQIDFASWLQSLPEMNPMLEKTISYLAGPTGLDTLAYTQKNPLMSLSELIMGTAKTAASIVTMG